MYDNSSENQPFTSHLVNFLPAMNTIQPRSGRFYVRPISEFQKMHFMKTPATHVYAAALPVRVSYFRLLIVLLILMTAAASRLNAAVKTASVAGNFSAGATWGGTAPVPGDDIIINANVTMDMSFSATNFTINATRTLTGSATAFVLTVTGNFINNGTYTGNALAINVTGTGANAGTFTNGSGGANFNSSLTISAGTVNMNTGNFSVLGATSVTGALTDGNNGGGNTFSGAVTVNAAGSISSANTSTYIFQGNIANAGTINKTGTGNVTFDNGITISGAGAITFAGAATMNGATTITGSNVTFTGVVTATSDVITSNASGSVNFTGGINVAGDMTRTGAGATQIAATAASVGPASVITGNLTVGAGSIFHIGNGAFTVTGTSNISGPVDDNGNSVTMNTFTSATTINVGGSYSVLTGVSGSHTTFGSTLTNAGSFISTSGGGNVFFNGDVTNTGTFTKTGAAVITTNNTIVISSNSNLSLAGNIITNGATTISTGAFSFSAGGTFTANGDLTLNTGATTFTGAFTNAVGTVTTINSAALTFSAAITANGDFNIANTGAGSFATSFILNGNGTFSGPATTTISGAVTAAGTWTVNTGVGVNVGSTITVGAAGFVINKGTVTFTSGSALNGSSALSSWVNDVNAVLNYNGAAAPMSNGILDASAAGNTVNYAGAGQNVKQTTYHHISFAGSGNKAIPDIIVNGNFNRAAGLTMSMTGGAAQVIRFEGSSSATFAQANVNQTFNNIIVDKNGGSLTIVPGGAAVTTTFSSLTISFGSLNMGVTGTTLVVTGDLGGAGNINMSGATHALTLRGANNNIGSLTSHATPSLGTVTYDRAGDQNIFGTNNYNNLTLANTTNGTTYNKNLNGPVGVGGTLSLTNNFRVILGSNDVKIKATGSLTSPSAFGVNKMFVTDGTGNLIKEGTTAANFTTAMNGTGLYPVGNSGPLYTPYEITSLAATVSGTGTVSVRAVPSRQPNVPYYNNDLIKYWDVETSNISGITATFRFTFVNPTEVIGAVGLYEARLWNGSSLILPAGASPQGSNPVVITGGTMLAGEWTAMDPTIRTTLYSYQSGDWATANTWTTDPSGSTLVSPIVPGVGDQVVILNGRTVTTSVSRIVGTLKIENGAVLDLASTTGHNFGTVSGDGLLRLSSTNWPAGTFTSFVSSTGGTVEYYDLPAASNLSNQATYNNLLFTNSTATSYVVNSVAAILVNGNLNFSRSGAGTVTFNLATGAVAYTYNVIGDVNVGAGCTMAINAGCTTQHLFRIWKNLSVDGSIDFQNGAAYTNTSGRSVLDFQGSVYNATATFNSGSNCQFYTVLLNKNEGYELYMSASPTATVLFNGVGELVDPLLGTMRLGPNITVPMLETQGNNYEIGAPGVLPVLWIDGANVTYGSPGGAIVAYGTMKITAGSLTNLTGQASMVIRESGLYQQEGGTSTMHMFRTSNTAVTHRGSFVMTGGTMTLLGLGGPQPGYAVFTLPYAENVFKMSGGTINVTRQTSYGIPANAGIIISSTPQNYDVTGGTINVNVTGANGIDICSTAPFYNLNIGRVAGATGVVRNSAVSWSSDNTAGNTVALPGQPLTVLNDFAILTPNAPVFQGNGLNILVGNNFTVNTGSTYTPGTGTLIFNGNGAQSFTVNGTITAPGIGNLTISKGAASTITVAGSAGTISVNGALNLLTGTFNDGGKTINVAGNITNNSIHSGTGKIALTGAAAQVIGGNDNGQFQNLEIAGTAGAALSSTSNLRINGNLNMAVNRIFSISINKLILSSTSLITSSAGSFSTSRFIATDGFQSDGGIVKTFSTTVPFVFPFGTGTNYTPATIQFSAAPATWGTLDVRPVNSHQLYITDPNAFNYYWKVRQTGFSGVVPGTVNHTYNYGNLADNASYIPGYYNYQAIAFTSINDVNQVDEPTNEIRFTGVTYFNGDFTAGVPAAFGAVIPYYSRTNGAWNVASTWSNAGFGGAPSATIPNATVPVFIGDGNLYFHTVTVPVDNVVSGSLIIDAGSTLDLGNTVGHNFGALPYATAGGAGKVRIASVGATAQFPAGDFGLFFTAEGGTTEYYSSAIDFTLPLVTAAPTNAQIRSYRNLILAPSAGRTINMPNRDLEIFEDLKVAGNAAGVAALNEASSKILNIRRDLLVTSGVLRFKNNSSQSVIVDQNISVSIPGTFDVENTGSRVHTISVEGNLTNNGTINFNQASDVNITFIGNINKSITGSNVAAVTSINNLILNKGTSNTVVLNVDLLGTLTAPTNNWLQLQNGSFRLAKATTLTLNDQPGNVFFVPSTAGIIINNPSAVINAGMANDNGCDFSLGGLLQITNGTMNIGNSANMTHNDLEYSATDIPKILIDGSGVLNVNGQIRRSVNVLLGTVEYVQKDNSVVLVRGRNPEAAGSFNLNRAKFEITNAGSSFTMQDNALLIIDRTGQASGIFGDIFLDPTTASVTGGEIRIGTGNTPISQTFMVNATTPFWNLTVDGTTTSKTARILSNPVTVQNDLSINGNSIFDAFVYNVTIGGDLVNQNSSSTDGIGFGGYRVGNLTQVTTFNGSTGNQSITGAGTNLTNFGSVVINNTTGSINLGTNTNLSINGTLSVLAGNVNAGTNNITVDQDVLNNQTVTNTGAGYFILGTASSSLQTLSGNGSGVFGNVRVNNPAGVEMVDNFTINGIMNFTSGNFYINNHLLTLGLTATISGTNNASSMIRLNGVASDAGVKKLYPAAPLDFTFPIGVTLKYTPARISVSSNTTAGTVTVKPINTRHPATTDPANTELTYYWNTSSTGFNGSTVVTHVYTYTQTDAANGNESLYRTGRYFNNVWTPQFGIPASVNSTLNTATLTSVNYFDGDFTAGEQNEFDQLLYFYSITSGNWNTPGTWSTDQILQHTGAPSAVAPSFNSVIIAPAHTVTSTANNISAPTAEINGTLILGNTIGHNLGTVTGTGTVRITPTGTNQFIFPGGNFSTFTNSGGGTFEFNSTGVPASMPTQSVYNNLTFTGTGTKNLANIDVLVNGNLTISAGSVNNVLNKNINLKGNFTNTPGVAGFTAGTGTFSLTGAAQALTGATTFYRLTVNGAGVKTVGSSITVNGQLNLTSGILSTGLNQVSIAAAATVINGSAASYVAGNLQKFIAASTTTKLFEVGDAARYAPVTLTFVGTTNSTGSITASTTAGDHPSIGLSTMDASKSVNRHWTLFNSGVTGFTSYNAVFNFNALDVDGGANTSAFSVGRFSGGSWTFPTIGTRTATTTQMTGLAPASFGAFQVGEIFNGTFIWNGSVSQDWHNPGNWTPAIVPGASDNVRITTLGAFQPSFLSPGNGFCKNIQFDPGTTILIPAGYTLFVSGNWTGSSNTIVDGDGMVTITGSAAIHTGTTNFKGVLNIATGANFTTNAGVSLSSGASLMHGTGTPGAGGTITGNMIIRRTGASNPATYNFWSSPISNGTVNSLGGNRYIYNPNDATGSDVEGLRDGWVAYNTGAMAPGRGFIATGTGTATFTGIPNNGPVSYGPMILGAYTHGNLIGNPYPSAINAAQFITANPSITGGAIYLWDDDNSGGSGYAPSDYGVWNGLGFVGPNSGAPFNGNIASGQGFFIEASSGANINFTNAMRTTANDEFFETEQIERLWMNVTTAQGDYNETLIAFKEDASDEADHAYDAKKLRGNQNIALYSKIGSEDFAIQALSELSADKIVALGIEAGVNGPQTMRLKQVDNMDATAQIILEDMKLGVFHNLRNNPVYTYEFDKATDVNRFRLHFKPQIVITASTESCVQNDGVITIHSPSASNWNYSVVNSNGQSVAQAEAFTGTDVIENLNSGIYTVQLTNDFGSLIYQSVEIVAGAPVSASISASETTVDLNDDAIHFHAAYSGASDITWNFGDGTIVTGETDPSHLFTSPGTYQVTFIASNATCMDVKTIEINVKANATGIYSVKELAFSVYPNPASDVTSIKLNMPEKESRLTLNVLDAAGKLVMSREYENVDRTANIQLEVTELPAGVYQMLLNGKTFSTAARLTVAR